jgi:membrane protein required for colicin V production
MFQILDFVLFGIVLVSGLLAMARGFLRELMALVTWAAGGAAVYYALQNRQIMDLAGRYFDPNKPILAQVAVGSVAFVVVFLVLSIIGVRVSDRVVDSRVGAFDRTLGLIYGALRGLVLVSVCYIFYVWAVPGDRQEDWIRNAVSLPVINKMSEAIKNILPQQIRERLSNSDLKGNGVDTTQKAAAPAPAKEPAYPASQQQGLGTLSKNATGTAPGQDQKKQ